MAQTGTYSVVVRREAWCESPNDYVRWGDTSGDSRWYGGEIYVVKKYQQTDDPGDEPNWDVAPAIRKRAVLWCERWLPTDKGLHESTGWEVEFRVTEHAWESGAKTARLQPIITQAVREVMLAEAAQDFPVGL